MNTENEVLPPKKTNTQFRKIWVLFRRILSLTDDTDIELTVATIKKSVQFRGANIWILAFAIIIASVGLNVNSTAVIIGAMLISPLMGPINGIGFAIGTSDSEFLQKSLKNLLIMVVISLIASTTYFFLSPLSDAQSELLARTRPSIYDVLIALFGGFAGIVALTRKDQPITIISGVAIATALMPPLCTAGYGLATGQFSYFLGAFYLFFINSFFIALATFIMVRYLRFPQKKYVDARRSKIVRRTITIFTIIVIVPSIIMAVSMVREASFNTQAIKYVHDVQKSPLFEDVLFLNITKKWDRKEPTISFSLMGRVISDSEINHLREMLPQYGLEKTTLTIKQVGAPQDLEVRTDVLANILGKKEEQLSAQKAVIDSLKSHIAELTVGAEIDAQIAKEIAVQYPNIRSISLAHTINFQQGSSRIDTIPTLYVTWASEPTEAERQQLYKWLKIRLKLTELEVRD